LSEWLKSGSVIISRDRRNTIFEESYSGVPQGGILSPLLMNIVLNGMQELMLSTLINISKKSKNIVIRKKKTRITIGVKYSKTGDDVKTKYRDKNIGFFYCRYADDFIIGCASRHILKGIQKEIIRFLFLRGLVINNLKSKTIQFKEKISFDFLGYTFIRLKCSPYKRVTYLQSTTQEYRLKGRARLYIHPSKNSFKNICRKFKSLIRYNYNITGFKLINKINPLIQGWCNYFSLCNSTGTRDSLKFRM
jgi:RNA-directed DNA polymerase